MRKKIFINALHPEESRVAIVEEGILSEYEVEFAGREQQRGNIYKGIVVNTEPSLQAAFVDYGGQRFGFLQISEVNISQIHGPGASRSEGYPRIEEVLKPRQEILVQVIKDERGTKGAALTTYISLPGRYMVLMPFSDTHGVSRKIDSEAQRKKIKETMASFDLPEHTGYIVRTAAIGRKKEELRKDIDYLLRIKEKVFELFQEADAPALIYQESNMVIRFLRDYFDTKMDAVVVDNPTVFHEARNFFQDVLPDYAGLVKLHREHRPIFSRYQIEEQIAAIARNKVNLPSGGSIVIDATEALVAIDVNSGKTTGEGDIEKTAFKTNLEATTEIGRQLRLRDLGGLIVIDLIDMRVKEHIRDVEKNLKEALSRDKARINLSRISKFGLLEMSRQRIKTTLGDKSYLPCPHCQGSGRLKRVESLAIEFLRKLEAGLARELIECAEGEAALETAHYLLNEKRAALTELEKKYKATIIIKGCPELKADMMEIVFHKPEKAPAQKTAEEETETDSMTEQTAVASTQGTPSSATVTATKPATSVEDQGRNKNETQKPPHKKPTALSRKKTTTTLPAQVQSSSSEKETVEETSETTKIAASEASIRAQPQGNNEKVGGVKNNPIVETGKEAETNNGKPGPPANRQPRQRRRPAKKPESPAPETVVPSPTPAAEEKDAAKPVSRPRTSRPRHPAGQKKTPQKNAGTTEEKAGEKDPDPALQKLQPVPEKNDKDSGQKVS